MKMKNLVGIVLWMAAVYALNFFFAFTLNAYHLQILCLLGINALMAVSLNFVIGTTGLFSLGHAGFMALGAYTAAALTVYSSLFFPVALLGGGFMAAFVALVIGIPTLRLRGDYLAMATLGMTEIIRVLILNLDAVGGARGFGDIPEKTNFFWIYALLGLLVFLTHLILQSSRGKVFLAVREDEIAAESLGIAVSRQRIIAFVWSAFWAGIGGGLFAHLNTYLHTNSFTFLKSIEFVAMVVLGGMGSILGSLSAAALLTLLPELLRVASEFRMILYAVLLVLMMILRPQGLLGKIGKKKNS